MDDRFRRWQIWQSLRARVRQNVCVKGTGWTRGRKYAIRFTLVVFFISVVGGMVWTVLGPTTSVQAERATISGFLVAAASALAGVVGYFRDARLKTEGAEATPSAQSIDPSPLPAADEGTHRVLAADAADSTGQSQASPTSGERLTTRGPAEPSETPHGDNVAEVKIAVKMKAPNGNPILIEAYDTQSATILINQLVLLDPNERRNNA